MKKYVAEGLGTFVLVFFGCATIIFMLDAVGLLGVAFAFGLALVAMAYSIGHISGAHINPAVSLGAYIAGRLSAADLVGYVIAQIIGGIVAAGLLYIMAAQNPAYDLAASGVGPTSWGQFGVLTAFIYEIVATAMFLTVILASTQESTRMTQMAGLVIGLTLTLIHIAGILVSGASVNPARSIGPALFSGGAAISSLWLYIIAPLAGGAIGGYLFKAGITARDGD